jgi:23S rRNA (cytosine1962-C5)-methyltransferase
LNTLQPLLERAVQVRGNLLDRLQAEGTDCWRVFHGVAEGRPGLAVDRYGPLLLAQLFHGKLEPEDLHTLQVLAEDQELRLVLWRRGQGRGAPEMDSGLTCREEGQRFAIAERSPGLDPWLFLDFRAARRWLRVHVPAEASVLNLFAYTCSAGVAAARHGAEVWNVDFGRWCLEVGGRNRDLNGLDPERFHFWREDVFPILWQLSGKGVRGRAARREFLRVEPRLFDVVILDPPTLARSPFGKVDLLADYPAMLKPCLLALQSGGRVLATNHAAGVDRKTWEQVLRRTAEKVGRELLSLQFLAPEEDFPSPDGQPPLKIAILSVG